MTNIKTLITMAAPINVQPAQYVGVWKGVIKNKMIKIILETSSQSRKAVGWYQWHSIDKKADLSSSQIKPENDEGNMNAFSHISYDGVNELITLHAHNGCDELIITAWVNATTMLGLNEETVVTLIRV